MAKKIKILQFPIANSFGGITQYALNNWKWLDKTKFECDFATMSKKLDFADDILKTGSNIFYISCYAEQNKEQFIKEFNTILDNGYDIVHLHTKQWKSFLIEELCKERHISKVIVHSHSTKCDNNNKQIREQETQLHYKVRELINEDIATDFWACSKEAADWLFGDKIPQNRIRIMNNAIETERFLFNPLIRDEYRKKYHLENLFVIGNVGRLSYPKNQDFLIEAFSYACYQRDDLFLVIIGEGDLKEQLEKKAKMLGVINRILFLGKRDDVNKLYQMMDLFVLPSIFEGTPISAIEAQTSGLRVIISDVITREVDVTGRVVFLPLTKERWVTALVSSMHYERKNIENDIIKKEFDIKTQIKEIEKEYFKVYKK